MSSTAGTPPARRFHRWMPPRIPPTGVPKRTACEGEELNHPDTTASAVRTSEVSGLCLESLLLVGISLADAISTIVFVSMGMAVEFNPVMAYFLNQSAGLFLLAKTACTMPFIVACEYYRRREPIRARAIIRLAIWAYVAVYVAMVVGVNIGRI